MDVKLHDQQLLGNLTMQVFYASGIPVAQASNGNLAAVIDFSGFPSHGIVLSEASGLTLVAGGCPAGIGCGDPTPIGGTFSTMIHSSENVPAVNSRGDVLFLSDVDGGSSTRALFLYARASQTIQKIAAIGDPTPIGGTFGSVGLGSINDQGEVVFLAWRTSYQDAMILRWNAGVLHKVVATGDTAPGGGTFVRLVYMQMGPLPAAPAWPPHITEAGQVFFLASVNTVGADGMYSESNQQISLIAKWNDAAPGGGTFSDCGVPVPNEQGEIAFSAQSQHWTWFRGRPGQWERVMGIGDIVHGHLVLGITVSKGSIRSNFDDAGNLLLPANLRDLSTNVTNWAIVLARKGVPPEILVKVGDPSPMGGLISKLPGYASMTPNSVAVVGMELATPAGAVDAHVQMDICVPPDATIYCSAKTNSAGCLPAITALGIPSASAVAGFVVQAEQVLNARPGLLIYSVTGAATTPFGGGTLCVNAPVNRSPAVPAGGSPLPLVDCTGRFRIDMNAFAAHQLGGNPALALSTPGSVVFCQWYGRDPGSPPPTNVQLSDAVQYRVVP